jgi:hypothetical protein
MLDEVGSQKNHFDFRINRFVLIKTMLVHEWTRCSQMDNKHAGFRWFSRGESGR